MILALEGPDRAGKTTMWTELQQHLRATFIPRLPLSSHLLPFMHLCEQRELELWKLLHRESELYVMDRSPFVSGPVYDRLYNRPSNDVSYWYDRVKVAYVDTPLPELKRRYKATGDKLFAAGNYEAICAHYRDVLRDFEHIRITQTHEVVAWLRSRRFPGVPDSFLVTASARS